MIDPYIISRKFMHFHIPRNKAIEIKIFTLKNVLRYSYKLYPKYIAKLKSDLRKHSERTGSSTGLIKHCLIT